MFSPDGFVPFSIASADFDEWLSHLVQKSIDYGDPYKLKDFSQLKRNSFCTNLSYSEAAWFLDDCQSMSICGFDGTLLKPHKMHLLERVDFVWNAEWFPKEKIFPDARFLFVNPLTFTVTLKLWENHYSDIYRTGVYEDWLMIMESVEIFSRFDKWAFCISEEDDARIPDYIIERLRLPKELLAEDSVSMGLEGTQKRGRPPLSKAREAFERMNLDKGDLSWGQLALRLEQKTGQKPSARTLRTWMEEGPRHVPPREK